MANKKNPRYGTLQFWPRKRAKKETGLVRTWANKKDAIALGFAGYKAGMLHIIATDNRPKTLTKGQDIQIPVTVIECPPLKVLGIRYYKNNIGNKQAVYDKLSESLDKELSRKIIKPKKTQEAKEELKYDDLVLICHTQPKLTSTGKKKPEIFEVAIGGNKADKEKYANEVLGKEISVKDVFKEGEQLDIHSVSIGKGFQGVVKRCGVSIKQHKAEKAKRTASPAGAWNRENQTMWRNPKSGKMGYWLRTHYNQQLIKIGDKPEEINPKSGIKHYGNVKTTYIFVKGNVPGPKKRIIRFNHAIRPNYKVPKEAPEINYAHIVGM